MKDIAKKTISVFWITLLLTLVTSDMVLGASTETRIFDFGYISNAENSVNLLDPNRLTEQDNINQDNFTFFSDGISHGSDVPESKITLKRFKDEHNHGWLKLIQDVTFSSSIIMSGSAKFWIRLPLDLCKPGYTPGGAGEGACPTDRMYEDVHLWINNTETNQTFFFFDLYNDGDFFKDIQHRYDLNNGRPIIEINMPIYSNQKYRFSIIAQVKEDDDIQPVFYTSYGDLGNDGELYSGWQYIYYDTITGKEVIALNNYYPIDLGYYFIFQEGMPSTGALSLKFTVPEGRNAFIPIDTQWNKTNQSTTYHTYLPIAPAGPYNLTMDIEVLEYNNGFSITRAVYLDDIQWRGTGILFSFDYNVSYTSTSFFINLYPQNNQSQQFNVGMIDLKVPETHFAYTSLRDGQTDYFFKPYYYQWRGTNFTTIPRSTRSYHQEPEAKGTIPIRSTRGLCPPYVPCDRVPTPEIQVSSINLDSAMSGATNIIIAQGETFAQSNKDSQVLAIVENTVSDGIRRIESTDYELLETEGGDLIPQMQPRTIQSASNNAYTNANTKDFLNTIGTVGSLTELDSSGTILESTTSIIEAISNEDSSQMSVSIAEVFNNDDGFFKSDGNPIGELIDSVGEIISSIVEMGASLIASIIEVVTAIISMLETVLSIAIIGLSFTLTIILILFGGYMFELLYLLSRGDFKGMYNTTYHILKGGGGGT